MWLILRMSTPTFDNFDREYDKGCRDGVCGLSRKHGTLLSCSITPRLSGAGECVEYALCHYAGVSKCILN